MLMNLSSQTLLVDIVLLNYIFKKMGNVWSATRLVKNVLKKDHVRNVKINIRKQWMEQIKYVNINAIVLKSSTTVLNVNSVILHVLSVMDVYQQIV